MANFECIDHRKRYSSLEGLIEHCKKEHSAEYSKLESDIISDAIDAAYEEQH